MYVSTLDFAVTYDFQSFSDELNPLGSESAWMTEYLGRRKHIGFVLLLLRPIFRVFATSCFAVFNLDYRLLMYVSACFKCAGVGRRVGFSDLGWNSDSRGFRDAEWILLSQSCSLL